MRRSACIVFESSGWRRLLWFRAWSCEHCQHEVSAMQPVRFNLMRLICNYLRSHCVCHPIMSAHYVHSFSSLMLSHIRFNRPGPPMRPPISWSVLQQQVASQSGYRSMSSMNERDVLFATAEPPVLITNERRISQHMFTDQALREGQPGVQNAKV